jgi:hypothetical protein
VTNCVRSDPRTDSLLAHCIGRAIIAEAGGLDAVKNRWGDDAEGWAAAGKWTQLRTLMKVTPKASRVAAFVIQWAWAMRDEGRDSYTITEFQRYWNEGERQAYRHQAEFRELWPEFETPDELARQIVPHLNDKLNAATLPTEVVVVA